MQDHAEHDVGASPGQARIGGKRSRQGACVKQAIRSDSYNRGVSINRFLERAMSSSAESTRARLADELSHAVAEAHSILQHASTETGERAHDLRLQVEDKLRHARHKLQDLNSGARDQALGAARAADDFVHARPWQAVGVAAAAGVVLGLLLSRR